MFAFPSSPLGSNAYQTQAPSLTAKGDPRQFVKHNYTDHSHEQGDINYARRYNLECCEHDNTQEGGDGISSKLQPVAEILQSPTFPLKLHMILDKIEKSDSNMKKAISWLPHGRAFHIRNGDIFKREILPKYFKNCKMSSFYRQINLYGFVRLTTGCETGAYYHEYFLRERAFLTKNIARTKVKGTKIRMTSAPKDEPNFYEMAPVCSMQQSIGIPSETVPNSNQGKESIAFSAAMREMERISYTNAESRNYGYSVPQNAIQSSFLGGMASPQESVSHPSSLSPYNLDGYLADNSRPPYHDMPRTVHHDMLRAAAVQSELSRTALHNETSRTEVHTEMARAVIHNEMTQAAMHNEMTQAAMHDEMAQAAMHNEMTQAAMHDEMTQAAMHNELSRNIRSEMPRMAHHIEIPQTLHNIRQRAMPTSNLATRNSPHRAEEMKMMPEMTRAEEMRAFSNMATYSNLNHL